MAFTRPPTPPPVTSLIDAVVRQTTVLLAHLATASGQRATLASVANQVFADLVRELKQQGLGNKVIADMFGMALRAYHKKVARLAESHSARGQSIWEAVLDFVQERGGVLRTEVLARFSGDEDAVVRSVLNDLVDNGLLFRTGAGERTSYRAARPEELPALPDREAVVARLLLVALHQQGPLSEDELLAIVPMERAVLVALLNALVDDGRAQRDAATPARYRCEHLVIGFADPVGWQAAIYDHYQAMVGALCHKLQLAANQATPGEWLGGSTYTFDLWPGHPMADEVLGLLSRLRKEAAELRVRVDTHNAQQPAPRDGDAGFRVVTYVGQNTIGYQEDGEDD
jgi:hypothetical protein